MRRLIPAILSLCLLPACFGGPRAGQVQVVRPARPQVSAVEAVSDGVTAGVVLEEARCWTVQVNTPNAGWGSGTCFEGREGELQAKAFSVSDGADKTVVAGMVEPSVTKITIKVGKKVTTVVPSQGAFVAILSGHGDARITARGKGGKVLERERVVPDPRPDGPNIAPVPPPSFPGDHGDAPPP